EPARKGSACPTTPTTTPGGRAWRRAPEGQSARSRGRLDRTHEGGDVNTTETGDVRQTAAQQVADRMAEAARAWLDALDPGQRAGAGGRGRGAGPRPRAR